ncbi:MAG: hypothetical protein IJK97_09700, partial [Thermoguttaceae bacterium]|nr:hypothetical protein [Thermoguttaceae bacterium]
LYSFNLFCSHGFNLLKLKRGAQSPADSHRKDRTRAKKQKCSKKHFKNQGLSRRVIAPIRSRNERFSGSYKKKT